MTLQHLRSSTANKRPDPTAMADGQIALNTAAASPGLFYKDSAGNLVKAGPVHVGSTAPNVSPASGGTAGNSTGEAWLDTSGSNPLLKIWGGAAWQTVQPVASGTVVSTADTGSVTSTMIANGTIVDADVNASAAIAGTKISPNFGSQTITTTGVVSAAAGAAATPSITFTGDTNTGIYSPGADQVAISTGGFGRLFINSTGSIGINTSSIANPGTSIVPLEIKGTATDRSGALVLSTSDSSQQAWQYFAANAYRSGTSTNHDALFITNNTERLRITAAGLVGVGTSSPSELFNVATSSVSDTTLIRLDGGAGIRQRFFPSGGTGKFNWQIAAQTNVDNGFEITPSSTSGGSTFSTPAVVVKSNGNVGIGASDPQRPLDVVSNSSAETVTFRGASANNISTLRFNSNNAATNYASIQSRPTFFELATAASVPLVLSPGSGTGVGIGTSTPSRTLDCAGDIRSYANATEGSLILGSNNNAYIASNSAELRVWTRDTRPVVFIVNDNERARIDSSGRLLVGTSSYSFAATAVLQGNSSASNEDAALRINRGGTPGANADLGLITFGDNAGNIGAAIRATNDTASSWGSGDYPGRLTFSTTSDGASSPTERMRIDNAGTTKFTAAAASTNLVQVVNDNATPTGIAIEANFGNATGTNTNTAYLYSGRSGGAQRFYVYGNGGIANYSANNSNLSDRNSKKDISPAAGTWDCIKEWEIVNYRYKDQPDNANLNLGVIAQQVAESCPEVITVFEQATEDKPEKLGIKEQQMYWMAIKALQEAQMRIEQLEAKVAALESA